jgi:DsbC/DsbD-like thiol-disulfide interchange protein
LPLGRQLISMPVAIACATALLSAQAHPAKRPVASPVIETPHLEVTTSSSPSSVAPGGRVSLVADIAPKPKMHVYAPGQDGYVTVSLRLDPQADVTAHAARLPAGQPLFFPATGETQLVYSKPFRIELPVTIARGRKAGPLPIAGTLEYQACDDTVCYVARKVALKWTVAVR